MGPRRITPAYMVAPPVPGVLATPLVPLYRVITSYHAPHHTIGCPTNPGRFALYTGLPISFGVSFCFVVPPANSGYCLLATAAGDTYLRVPNCHHLRYLYALVYLSHTHVPRPRLGH